MSDGLVLEIEIPDFNVEGARDAAALNCPPLTSLDQAIDEELEAAMLCSDSVVVVFVRTDEVDGTVMEAMRGRIRRRALEAKP